MKIKIPPPLVALIIMFPMWWLGPFFQWAHFEIAYTEWVALLIAGSAISISMAGFIAFRNNQTTVNPLAPETASTLVVESVYGFTRNPMYLGLLLLILSWGLFLSNWFIMVLPPVIFVIYMNFFQIRYEEEALEILFGEGYENYKRKVRRWL